MAERTKDLHPIFLDRASLLHFAQVPVCGGRGQSSETG